MKCLILAGGRGERLWPLSRKNFPKQFIQIQKNHSIFQETVARNLPFCDEFIIVTNAEYKDIVVNQMESFQGVPYRCIYEATPRKTLAAIALACLSLPLSEFIFVVTSDHLIDTAEGEGSYQECIRKAREAAAKDKLVLFGRKTDKIDSRFGYLAGQRFFEKPDPEKSERLKKGELYQNIGLMLFQNGTFLNELRRLDEKLYYQCENVFEHGFLLPGGILYKAETLETIKAVSVEKAVLERTDKICLIPIGFEWKDVGRLEDLERIRYNAGGIGVLHESDNSVIINQSNNKAVVINELSDLLVVNTDDAVYVGKKGESFRIKDILRDSPELDDFSNQGLVIYRPWGFYAKIAEAENYRIRHVTILPGKTIYEHKHEERREIWTILQGSARISLAGVGRLYKKNETIEVRCGIGHQISNAGEEPLILIETAVGESLHGGDILPAGKGTVTETDLGIQIDPIVKLAPVFKDNLWGGTKLRDVFGKRCDYDTIAESWELSAHPDGNCKIASGRHRGLSFSKYLDTVGRSVLGWKCLRDLPLLVKFIDAKENLSVQVHPDDDYALKYENEYGKNEMWYIMDAEPGAGLYIGFNKDVTREEIAERISDNTILDIMNFFSSHPGDVFYIPAGTVHAIGAGNLLCEIQQNSNTTYRLYDYDRADKFGNKRELHLEKALDVLHYEKYSPVELEREGGKIRCKYFEVEILPLKGDATVFLSDDSFSCLVCLSGSGRASVAEKSIAVKAGKTFFLPAANGPLTLSGNMTVAITRI